MCEGYFAPLMLWHFWSVKTSLNPVSPIVRSGRVESDSKLYNPGNNANYWSRSSYSSAERARYLYFDGSNVYPSTWTYRYNGLSLRCLYAG